MPMELPLGSPSSQVQDVQVESWCQIASNSQPMRHYVPMSETPMAAVYIIGAIIGAGHCLCSTRPNMHDACSGKARKTATLVPTRRRMTILCRVSNRIFIPGLLYGALFCTKPHVCTRSWQSPLTFAAWGQTNVGCPNWNVVSICLVPWDMLHDIRRSSSWSLTSRIATWNPPRDRNMPMPWMRYGLPAQSSLPTNHAPTFHVLRTRPNTFKIQFSKTRPLIATI